MFCNQCGNHLAEDNLYCPKCGNKVAQNKVPKESTIDEQLLEAISNYKNGNIGAFNTIYEKTFPFVFSRSKYILKESQDAMDLSQEVYIALCKGITDLKNDEGIFGWLKTVTLRKGITFIEKRNKTILLSEDQQNLFDQLKDEDIDIEEGYMKEDDANTIKACIDQLSEEQRLVILAYYYDNMKVEDIAELFGVNAGTVKSRLYLARKRLEMLLSKEEEKQGYKFYAFGAPMLTLAIGSALKAECAYAGEVKDSIYSAVCEAVGLTAKNMVMDVAVDEVAESASSGILSKIVAIGSKKLILGAAGIVIAGSIAGSAFIGMDNDTPKVDNPETPPPTEVVAFNEEAFLEEIRPNIECLESCVFEKYGAEEGEGRYAALYNSEEDAYDRVIAEMIPNSDVDDLTYEYYYPDPLELSYAKIQNFKTNADVRAYLGTYMSDEVVSSWFHDDFVEYGDALYKGYGGKGNIASCDVDTYQYVEEKGGKHYVLLDFAAGDEYNRSELLEFTKIDGNWKITNEKRLTDSELTGMAKEGKIVFPSNRVYASILFEYRHAEEQGFSEDDRNYDNYDYVNQNLFLPYWDDSPLYYAFVDLADDGTPELVIQQGIAEDELSFPTILGIYGFVSERAEELKMPEGNGYDGLNQGDVPMGERYTFTLCENNLLKEKASGGADSNVVNYHRLPQNSVVLSLEEGAINEGENYYETSYDDGIGMEITRDAYMEMDKKYAERDDIAWTKLSDFTWHSYSWY